MNRDLERRTALLAMLALLAMTACWGSTFFLIKDLLDRLPVLDFLAVRFAVASVALWLLSPRSLSRLSRESVRHAIVLGLLYGVAQILQTAGLAHTPASVSGFITGMYVVCTPVFAAMLLRSRITATTWGAVALAMVGLELNMPILDPDMPICRHDIHFARFERSMLADHDDRHRPPEEHPVGLQLGGRQHGVDINQSSFSPGSQPMRRRTSTSRTAASTRPGCRCRCKFCDRQRTSA